MRLWKEQNKEPGRMSPMGSAGEQRDPSLVPDWIYFVRVCGFTFEFRSIEQIETALSFFSRKTHPSSRLPGMLPPLEDGRWRGDHECAQRWFERLPMRLQSDGKREQVIAALQKALTEFA